MTKEYPAWIDDCARSIHQAFVGMTPADWGPLHFFECYRALNSTFIAKLYDAVTALKEAGVTPEEAVKRFASPSGFRAVFYFAILEYGLSDHTHGKEAREVFDYFNEILQRMFKRDIWAIKSNIIHTDEVIKKLESTVQWANANPDIARSVARLGNSASALSYSLYRDYYVAESQEVYGPYDLGDDATLIIKHYPKLRPTALWQSAESFEQTDIKIYLMYRNIGFKCEFIGMHTLYEGDLMTSLEKYAVEIDGVYHNDPQAIKQKMEYIGELAVEQWKQYESMSKEDIKNKFLEWVCHAYKEFFELASMDWHPTYQMYAAFKGKDIPDRLILDGWPPYEEYVNSPDWEVYWLRELYAE
ncbi:MAG TPA: hypothetical protein VJH91_02780 [Candidatus Paceibacterota bacterium]